MQTWGWADTLTAVHETDAALRRKLQRGQVTLEGGADAVRTQATLWDIARLRVSRYLCDIGIEAERAFGLATRLVNDTYKELIEGTKSFTVTAGERQQFMFPIVNRATGNVGPIVRLKPQADEIARKEGLAEIGLQAANPANIIVPLHRLILDAWYSLPDLPGDAAEWMRASSMKLDQTFGG